MRVTALVVMIGVLALALILKPAPTKSSGMQLSQVHTDATRIVREQKLIGYINLMQRVPEAGEQEALKAIGKRFKQPQRILIATGNKPVTR